VAAASAIAIPKTARHSVFTNQHIAKVAAKPPVVIGRWVTYTAHKRRVMYRSKPTDRLAQTASRLSDAEAHLDSVENLMVALGRAKVITAFQRGLLQVNYLR